MGEICSATSRLIIEEGVADKFFSKLKEMTETIVVGNPLDRNTRLGPVVNESQYEKVLGYIEVSYLNPNYSWYKPFLVFHVQKLASGVYLCIIRYQLFLADNIVAASGRKERKYFRLRLLRQA